MLLMIDIFAIMNLKVKISYKKSQLALLLYATNSLTLCPDWSHLYFTDLMELILASLQKSLQIPFPMSSPQQVHILRHVSRGLLMMGHITSRVRSITLYNTCCQWKDKIQQAQNTFSRKILKKFRLASIEIMQRNVGILQVNIKMNEICDQFTI